MCKYFLFGAKVITEKKESAIKKIDPLKANMN